MPTRDPGGCAPPKLNNPSNLVHDLLAVAAHLTTVKLSIEKKLATRPTVASKIIVDIQFLRDIAKLTNTAAELIDETTYIIERDKNF